MSAIAIEETDQRQLDAATLAASLAVAATDGNLPHSQTMPSDSACGISGSDFPTPRSLTSPEEIVWNDDAAPVTEPKPAIPVPPPTRLGESTGMQAVTSDKGQRGCPATTEADCPSQQPVCDGATFKVGDDIAAKKYSESDFIAMIKVKIEKVNTAAAKDKLAYIEKQIAVGALLTRLKRGTDHGKWAETVTLVGYNRQVAQRLTRLFKSPLAREIRTRGTHLTDRLPVDMQKLAALAILPADRLAVALDSGVDLDVVSRSRLRIAVKHLKDCGQWLLPATENMSEENARLAKVPAGTDAKPTAAKSSPTGNNKPAIAAEVSGAARKDCDEAKPEPVADGAARRKRLVRFTRLMDENSQHHGDKAIRVQTEAGFPEFVSDVLAVARKHGRKLCNEACKAVGGDGELLAMSLIGRLKKENLETLFGTDSLRGE